MEDDCILFQLFAWALWYWKCCALPRAAFGEMGGYVSLINK